MQFLEDADNNLVERAAKEFAFSEVEGLINKNLPGTANNITITRTVAGVVDKIKMTAVKGESWSQCIA